MYGYPVSGDEEEDDDDDANWGVGWGAPVAGLRGSLALSRIATKIKIQRKRERIRK